MKSINQKELKRIKGGIISDGNNILEEISNSGNAIRDNIDYNGAILCGCNSTGHNGNHAFLCHCKDKNCNPT